MPTDHQQHRQFLYARHHRPGRQGRQCRGMLAVNPRKHNPSQVGFTSLPSQRHIRKDLFDPT
jgi:hypothetical protein